MTSFATPRSPIHSRTSEQILRHLALLAAVFALPAAAHQSSDDTLPKQPGWRFDAAAALQAADANERWPAPRWPGVLTQGNLPRDRRGRVVLEHGSIGAAARFNDTLAAEVGLGWHDREGAHVETARLQLRGRGALDGWSLAAGRGAIPMGATLTGAGHYDRFGEPPLVKRALFDGDWIDDGITAAWQQPVERGVQRVELGAWRGRVYPGGPHGPAMPALLVRSVWDDWAWNVFGARLRPDARGSSIASGDGTHRHAVPDCRDTLQQVVCFDGRVDLLASSLNAVLHDWDLTLSAAGVVARERGSLYSLSGNAAWRSTTRGGWVEANWALRPQWVASLRAERLVPNASLAGIGATLLAREAGLRGAAPVTRYAAAFAYDFAPGWSAALEAGRERSGDGSRRYALLRLLWTPTELLAGRW